MKIKFLQYRVLAPLRALFLSCYLISTLVINNAGAKVIYQSTNELGALIVEENQGMRRLFFSIDSNISQSLMKLDQPYIVQNEYIKFLLGSLFLNKAPDNILLIGLGGGTAAKAINTILPQAKLDIVEINPLIPSVAEKFFLYNPNSNTEITVGDGYQFVLNAGDSRYDLIILDAFDKNYIPAPFLTDKFVKNIKRILKKNGAVAVNTFEGTQFSEIESELYKNIFKSFFTLSNGASKIIITKTGVMPTLSQIKENAKHWTFSLYRLGIRAEDLAEKFNYVK